MRRVLMISPHFPPDTSASAHRVRLLAPHLPAFGWDPTVLTVEPSAYEGALDPDLTRLVPSSLRVLHAPAWPARVTRTFGIGDLGLRSLSGLRRVADQVLRRERFDALFITIFPSYPALLGPLLKRQHHIPFVLDYQDPWVGSWGYDVGGAADGTADLKSRLSRALAKTLEPPVVRAADAITAVSARTYEDVLARVTDAHPKRCEAIPLGFELRDLELLLREPRRNPYFDGSDGYLHLCYVGTVLPMGFDVLRALLRAVVQLREQAPSIFRRVRLHFFGTSNQRDPDAAARVLPVARELGLEEVVTEVPPRLDYLDALNVQLHAHALLLLGSSQPHYTPSKVFPAILSGRPILAIYHSASPVIELLERRPRAVTVMFDEAHPIEGRVRAIADAFERLAAPADYSAVPVDEDVRLERWSTASLAGTLAAVLDEVA